MILRATNKIVELENERRVLQMQMQAEHKKIDLLAGLLVKEKKLVNEKKETLYHVEFNLQKCEIKLERIRGHERDKSEVDRKQKKIEELQTVWNEKTATSKLLQSQIASLEVSKACRQSRDEAYPSYLDTFFVSSWYMMEFSRPRNG